MSTGAKVGSIDALKAFKVVLFKFAENSIVALGDAESEMHRTLMWLEGEMLTYWSGQIRKRQELLGRAQEALRAKTLYKDASGRTSTAVDEQKVVAACKRKLEEAVQKLANVKSYSRRLQKEIEVYKGSVQRFATSVQSDVPVYASKLERLAATLEAYTLVTPQDMYQAASAEFSGEMARSAAVAAGYGGGEKQEKKAAPAEQAAADQSPGDQPPTAAAPAAAAFSPLRPEQLPALREQTPNETARLAAPPGFVNTANWGTRTLSNGIRQAIGSLGIEKQPPEPSSQIVIRRETHERPMIYLERVEAKAEGDSGWFMGPAEIAPPGEGEDVTEAAEDKPSKFESVRVSDFLAIRPDLQEALALPTGYLLVLGPGPDLALLNPQNRNIWPQIAPPEDAPRQREDATEPADDSATAS